MGEMPVGSAALAADGATTLDAFFNGTLVLRQPARGHRSGTDAILLAAAVPRGFAGLAYDVGAGVGAAGLGIASACPAARVRLIEKDRASAHLAEANVAANALAGRVSIAVCDLLDRTALRTAVPEAADLIVTNPPFHEAARVRASPDAGRRAAHVLAGGTLADWSRACLDLLAPRGTLIMLHAAAALPDILAAFGAHVGGVTALAVHPRAGQPATRVLVRGIRGSRAPFVVAAPLVLHEDAGFTAAAARLHSGEAGLSW